MTRRLELIGVALVAVGVIAYWLTRPPATQTEKPLLARTGAVSSPSDVVQFWRLFRGATAERIAGHDAEAAKAYRGALVLKPNHEDALYYLGSMDLHLGLLDSARVAWTRLVTVNSLSGRAHLQLGDLYLCYPEEAVFNPDSALSEYKRAHALNREETGSVIRLGEAELVRGNFDNARRHFDDVLRTNHRSVQANFFAGYLAWKKGDTAVAQALYLRAFKAGAPSAKAGGFSNEGDVHPDTKAPPRTNCPLLLPLFENLSPSDDVAAVYQRMESFLARHVHRAGGA